MAGKEKKVYQFLQARPSGATFLDLGTQLKLDISKLEEALYGLKSQGLIEKGRDEQGMETWFLARGLAYAAMPSQAAQSQGLQRLESQMGNPIYGNSYNQATLEMPQSYSKEDDWNESPTPQASSLAPSKTNIPSQPAAMANNFAPPEARGVGFGGLLFFFVFTLASSAIVAWFLGQMQIDAVRAQFVDRKVYFTNSESQKNFDLGTMAKVSGLEKQVGNLTSKIDSLQNVLTKLESAQVPAKAVKKPRSSRRR